MLALIPDLDFFLGESSRCIFCCAWEVSGMMFMYSSKLMQLLDVEMTELGRGACAICCFRFGHDACLYHHVVRYRGFVPHMCKVVDDAEPHA